MVKIARVRVVFLVCMVLLEPVDQDSQNAFARWRHFITAPPPWRQLQLSKSSTWLSARLNSFAIITGWLLLSFYYHH